jgi:hypothetical protein
LHLRQLAKDPAGLAVNATDLPPIAGCILACDGEDLVPGCCTGDLKSCVRPAADVDRIAGDDQFGGWGLRRGRGRLCWRRSHGGCQR